MHKFASGRLHSGGPSGPPVKSRSQAIAIMLSEKRKEKANGGKYPERTRPVKKSSGKMPGRTR
jgi:hypothetical protein